MVTWIFPFAQVRGEGNKIVSIPDFGAWKLYQPDRVIEDFWDDDPPQEELKEVTVLLVSYQGLIKQEIVFDKDNQEEQEQILERSTIKLDRIIEP